MSGVICTCNCCNRVLNTTLIRANVCECLDHFHGKYKRVGQE